MAYRGLFNIGASLIEKQKWCYLINIRGNKGIQTFYKGIRSKVNATRRLDFEFAHYDVGVKHTGLKMYVKKLREWLLIDRLGLTVMIRLR